MRRAKGWWKWYFAALDALAQRAYEVAMVVSDGDMTFANEARRHVRIRHYWHEAGQNAKGQDVFFCWTIRKDNTGHFRSWREVHTSTVIKRYDEVTRKSKAAAAEIARRRYNAFIGAAEDAEAPPPVDTADVAVAPETPEPEAALRDWLDKEWT